MTATTKVKKQICRFLASMIYHLYDLEKRKALVEVIKLELSQGSSLIYRNTYIQFCIESIKVFSYRFFREEFLGPYLGLAADPVPSVKISFLNSLPFIRPYLDHDVDTVIEINNLIAALKDDLAADVQEQAENIDVDMTRTKTVSKFSKDTEDKRVLHEDSLGMREKQEEENRKKKEEEEEEASLGQWMLTDLPKSKFTAMRRGTGFGGGPRLSQIKKPITSAGSMKVPAK